MKNNLVKYKILLLNIAIYLNKLYPRENYKLFQWYEAWESDVDEYCVHFVITNEKADNNKLDFEMVRQFYNNPDAVKEYFKENNVIYCDGFYKSEFDKKDFYTYYLNRYIDLDDAERFFKYIDSELLGNVIDRIKEMKKDNLFRSLLKK